MAADTAHAAYELVGMNGTVITTFSYEALQWGTVGEIRREMENGDVDGVPPPRTDEHGMYMERSHFLLGHSRMAPDEFVLDYFRTKRYVRVDRRMTLVRVPIDDETRMQIMRSIRRVATECGHDTVDDLIHLFLPPANEDFWDLWAQ